MFSPPFLGKETKMTVICTISRAVQMTALSFLVGLVVGLGLG
jgi:hypothetical protein